MNSKIKNILPYLKCPNCKTGKSFEGDKVSIICENCNSRFQIHDDILDLLVNKEEVTPITRVLYWPGVIQIYEKYWRPFLCSLVTPSTTMQQLKEISDIVVNKGNDLILDIACGPGIFSRDIAKLIPEGSVIGMDISMKMLKAASKVAKSKGINNIVFIRADVHKMPFIPEIFNGVNCCGAFHLFSKPILALEEIRNLLAPNGVFSCLTFINSEFKVIRFFQEILRKIGKFNFFNLEALNKLIGKSRFTLGEQFISKEMYIFSAKLNK